MFPPVGSGQGCDYDESGVKGRLRLGHKRWHSFFPETLEKLALRINNLMKRPTWRGIYSQHQLASHMYESN